MYSVAAGSVPIGLLRCGAVSTTSQRLCQRTRSVDHLRTNRQCEREREERYSEAERLANTDRQRERDTLREAETQTQTIQSSLTKREKREGREQRTEIRIRKERLSLGILCSVLWCAARVGRTRLAEDSDCDI